MGVSRSRSRSAEAEPATWSRLHARVFAAVVFVLALIPWTVKHWPSQDGQNHLAVAHVLMHYGDPGSPFPQYVAIQTGFRPSAALYEILCFAGRFVPLQTAEKALVSLAIVLLPSALLLFVRRALPRRSVNVMLALPFVLGWAFGMGFLNFQLGMGLGVVTLALGWEPPSLDGSPARITWRHAVASAAYFLCVWCHPVVALITGLGLVLLEWRNLVEPRQWARLLIVVGPAAVFLVGSYLAADVTAQSSAAPTETYFADPLTVVGAAIEYNLAYTPFELVPRLVAVAILLRFAYRSIRANSLVAMQPEAAVGRLFLVFLLLYCVTPGAFRGWFYSSTRFLLYAWLLLPAVAEIPARVGRRLLVLGPALAGVVSAIQWPFIHHVSRQMQDILDVGASLPRGAKLIPMDFTVSVLGPQPLGHAWAELVVDKDVVASQLFAAGKPRMGGERFRTLSFYPGLLDIDGGKLPWSTYETWNDVGRKCKDPSSPERWFVHIPGTCEELLAQRKQTLEAVIDRYDYVLMLEPPPYGRDLIAPHLRLVSHVGSAWMYAVVPADPATRSGSNPPR
jgi:hypothetical protein